MRTHWITTSLIIAVGMFVAGCSSMSKTNTCCAECVSIDSLVAVMHSTAGNTAHGVVRFTKVDDGVKVTADFEGLAPNSRHGFHIHEYGDCSANDGKCAGGHYNPDNNPHGLPPTALRHAGDLGNVQADADGKAHYEIIVHNITLAGMQNPILGRGMILHDKPDDGGQPTGNAGSRIACGVIGIAMPAHGK